MPFSIQEQIFKQEVCDSLEKKILISCQVFERKREKGRKKGGKERKRKEERKEGGNRGRERKR